MVKRPGPRERCGGGSRVRRGFARRGNGSAGRAGSRVVFRTVERLAQAVPNGPKAELGPTFATVLPLLVRLSGPEQVHECLMKHTGPMYQTKFHTEGESPWLCQLKRRQCFFCGAGLFSGQSAAFWRPSPAACWRALPFCPLSLIGLTLGIFDTCAGFTRQSARLSSPWEVQRFPPFVACQPREAPCPRGHPPETDFDHPSIRPDTPRVKADASADVSIHFWPRFTWPFTRTAPIHANNKNTAS